MAIHIRNQQRSKKLNLRRVRRDLAKALALTGHRDDELSLLFVGSRRMKHLNSRYRGIPKETDVLSFPMAAEEPVPFAAVLSPQTGLPPLLGDIVISVPRTIEQARAHGSSFHEELLRLLIHGLLHLIGYDHETDRRRRLRMEKKEKELLHALAEMD